MSEMKIGPIPLKFIVVVLILLDIIILEKKFYFDKIWIAYFLFVLLFFLSCLMTGFLDDLVISIIIKKYGFSYVGWLSTVVLIRKDRSFINYLTLLVLVIGVLDVAVTLSQFVFSDSWYSPIESFFSFSSSEQFDELMERRAMRSEVMDSTLPGMFERGSYNGYFLGVCCILSLVFMLKTRRSWFLVLPLLFLVALFCCQQRGPMFISLLVMAFIFYQYFRNSSLFVRVFVGVLLLVALSFSSYFSNFSELMGLRYTTEGLGGTGRDNIYNITIDYISSHPIIANYYELLYEKGHAPHNLFLNAYIYGGIFSFILIMIILFKQTKHCVKVIRAGFWGDNVYYYVYALAWVGYTLNGMVHNKSIVTGEPIVWVLWGVVLSCPFFHNITVQQLST